MFQVTVVADERSNKTVLLIDTSKLFSPQQNKDGEFKIARKAIFENIYTKIKPDVMYFLDNEYSTQSAFKQMLSASFQNIDLLQYYNQSLNFEKFVDEARQFFPATVIDSNTHLDDNAKLFKEMATNRLLSVIKMNTPKNEIDLFISAAQNDQIEALKSVVENIIKTNLFSHDFEERKLDISQQAFNQLFNDNIAKIHYNNLVIYIQEYRGLAQKNDKDLSSAAYNVADLQNEKTKFEKRNPLIKMIINAYNRIIGNKSIEQRLSEAVNKKSELNAQKIKLSKKFDQFNNERQRLETEVVENWSASIQTMQNLHETQNNLSKITDNSPEAFRAKSQLDTFLKLCSKLKETNNNNLSSVVNRYIDSHKENANYHLLSDYDRAISHFKDSDLGPSKNINNRLNFGSKFLNNEPSQDFPNPIPVSGKKYNINLVALEQQPPRQSVQAESSLKNSGEFGGQKFNDEFKEKITQAVAKITDLDQLMRYQHIFKGLINQIDTASKGLPQANSSSAQDVKTKQFFTDLLEKVNNKIVSLIKVPPSSPG